MVCNYDNHTSPIRTSPPSTHLHSLAIASFCSQHRSDSGVVAHPVRIAGRPCGVRIRRNTREFENLAPICGSSGFAGRVVAPLFAHPSEHVPLRIVALRDFRLAPPMSGPAGTPARPGPLPRGPHVRRHVISGMTTSQVSTFGCRFSPSRACPLVPHRKTPHVPPSVALDQGEWITGPRIHDRPVYPVPFREQARVGYAPLAARTVALRRCGFLPPSRVSASSPCPAPWN